MQGVGSTARLEGRLAFPSAYTIGTPFRYAVVQNLVWSSVPLATPPTLLNLSAGLIGCAVNVLLTPAPNLTPTPTPTLTPQP